MVVAISGSYVGGLGNQLFIIATALVLGRRLGIPVVFEEMPSSPSITSRRTYWESLLRGCTLVDPSAYRALDFLSIQDHQLLDCEHPVLLPERSYCVHGYCQDYRLIDADKSFLRACWGIDRWQEKPAAVVRSFPAGHVVGIHFRLGDYKHLQMYHPLLPDQYYSAAIRAVVEDAVPTGTGEASSIHFLIFTEAEDRTVVEHRLRDIILPASGIDLGEDGRSVSMSVASGEDELDEFFLLSCCDSIVIANSTFSWWAAYLSGHDRVYIPERWFGSPTPIGLRYPSWKLVSW